MNNCYIERSDCICLLSVLHLQWYSLHPCPPSPFQYFYYCVCVCVFFVSFLFIYHNYSLLKKEWELYLTCNCPLQIQWQFHKVIKLCPYHYRNCCLIILACLLIPANDTVIKHENNFRRRQSQLCLISKQVRIHYKSKF